MAQKLGEGVDKTRRTEMKKMLWFSLFLVMFMPLYSEDETWIELTPDRFEVDWELKENGFHSRRLSKTAVKKIEATQDEFVMESQYQSRGKFLCSKKVFSDFVLEAEVKVNDLILLCRFKKVNHISRDFAYHETTS